MNNAAVLVFMKNPVVGKVKTRLARSIGPENALHVYRQLLSYTRSQLKDVYADVLVYYSDFVDDKDEWNGIAKKKYQQQGHDLGEKMQNAFHRAFNDSYAHVVVIGTDCPEITTSAIDSATEALKSAEVVIGPAVDGGYYLLGMNLLHQKLFRNKTWSSNEVGQQTLSDCMALGLSTFQLATLRDVDTAEDLKHASVVQNILTS
jgi:rSAM/selenodomain-associated transferase 1